MLWTYESHLVLDLLQVQSRHFISALHSHLLYSQAIAYTIESLVRGTFLQLVLAMPSGEAVTVIMTCLRDHDHDWLISTIVDAVQPYLIPILEGMSDGCQSALFDDF